MAIEAQEGYVSANGGTVRFPAAQARRTQRTAYLASTTFSTYADLRPPIVRVSEDGSLGWVIAEVEIVGESRGEDGEPRAFQDVWAWIELYERTEDGWRMTGNVSNRR